MSKRRAVVGPGCSAVRSAIEKLEDRSLLAGNVLVQLGNTASVKGDGLDNAIEISLGSTPDEVVFRGLNGTTVNGSANPFVATVAGGLGSLNVNLGSGNDLVVVTNLSEATDSWPVASDPQNADDLVVGGDLSITSGKGDDVVLLRHVEIAGALKVNTGSEKDIIVAESVTAGSVSISTGSGNDQVLGRVLSVTGTASISTGSGADAVGVYNSNLHDKNRLSLGGDNDAAWIESNVVQDISLSGGSGSNELTEDFAGHNTVSGAAKVSKVDEHLELTAAVHFGYEDEIGPDFWGELTPAFLLSEVGRQQAPINIVTADLIDVTLPDIDVTYVPNTNVAFVHNGHTVQVNLPAGNSIEVDGDTYDLLQFHFHTTSENLVDGQGFPLEFHLVHRDAAGNLLVLGVFIEEGAENAAFDELIANLPNNTGTPSTVIPGPFNPEDLLPVDRDYYAYNGSLTTPPASERVSFAIFQTPIELSAAQIAAITTAIGGHNARPVQPVNDRQIFV